MLLSVAAVGRLDCRVEGWRDSLGTGITMLQVDSPATGLLGYYRTVNLKVEHA